MRPPISTGPTGINNVQSLQTGAKRCHVIYCIIWQPPLYLWVQRDFDHTRQEHLPYWTKLISSTRKISPKREWHYSLQVWLEWDLTFDKMIVPRMWQVLCHVTVCIGKQCDLTAQWYCSNDWWYHYPVVLFYMTSSILCSFDITSVC